MLKPTAPVWTFQGPSTVTRDVRAVVEGIHCLVSPMAGLRWHLHLMWPSLTACQYFPMRRLTAPLERSLALDGFSVLSAGDVSPSFSFPIPEASDVVSLARLGILSWPAAFYECRANPRCFSSATGAANSADSGVSSAFSTLFLTPESRSLHPAALNGTLWSAP